MRRVGIACMTFVLAASFSAASGCKLWKLRKDVAQIDAMGMIGGRVSQARPEVPVIVVLTASPPAGVIDSFVLNDPEGSYFFVVPAGTFQLAAFVDRNRDFAYQPGEDSAAYYGAPTAVQVAAGQKVADIDIRFDAASTRLDFPIALSDMGKRSGALPSVFVGEVVKLDDPRFTVANGNLGLWQPAKFMFDVGAGFYFLEPFDPRKTPVLFVHGAGGQPGDWGYLIEHLDRKKFQPWLFYYPSGLDLETLGRGAARWLSTLMARYEFDHFSIVAHSMGGLVSRATINQLVASGEGDRLSLFVSISTPWGGFGFAEAGAENSPVVMPMWVSMTPDSPFLKDLFRTDLPPDCPYFLMFSYKGSRSLVLGEQNDTVVALSSELVQTAQHQAKKVFGYDETHDSILTSTEVSEQLNTLLAEANGA